MLEAINRGEVFRYLTKPWQKEQLREALGDAARHAEVQRRAAALDAAVTRRMRALADIARREAGLQEIARSQDGAYLLEVAAALSQVLARAQERVDKAGKDQGAHDELESPVEAGEARAAAVESASVDPRALAKVAAKLHKTPRAELEKRLLSLENERMLRDAELLRMRNIASLNIMATGIAHELRQPLSLIRLAAQNARRDLQKGIASHVDADLADIDSGVARLDKIITVLQDAASDEVAIDEVIVLDDAIAAALSLFQVQLANREIEVVSENTSGVRVIGSRVALQQVLINLIGNARDALAEAQTKQIRILASEEGDKVRIEVSDTGCGMSEAVRARALDPFYNQAERRHRARSLHLP